MRHRAPLFISFILLLGGCTTTPPLICDLDLEIEPTPLPKFNLSSLDDAPRRNKARQMYVQEAFTRLGCNTVVQKLPNRPASNLICRISGTLDDEIVVSAHHDKLGAGKGFADNWSGIVLMFELIRHYQNHPPLHDLTFVAFAEEESGLLGSDYFVDRLTDTPRIAINIDTVGVGDVAVGHQSDEPATCLAKIASQEHDSQLRVTRIRSMSGDWEPFLKEDIPVIYFHSLNERTITSLHTFRDNRKLINDDKLLHAYNVIFSTLTSLDHAIDLTL